jgi:hypothetical protein
VVGEPFSLRSSATALHLTTEGRRPTTLFNSSIRELGLEVTSAGHFSA